MHLTPQHPHHVNTLPRYRIHSEKGWDPAASEREKLERACDRALQRGTGGMFRFWGDTIVRANGVNPT
jgi:hypothetical protein